MPTQCAVSHTNISSGLNLSATIEKKGIKYYIHAKCASLIQSNFTFHIQSSKHHDNHTKTSSLSSSWSPSSLIHSPA